MRSTKSPPKEFASPAVFHPIPAGVLVSLTETTETSVFVAASVRPVIIAGGVTDAEQAMTRARDVAALSVGFDSWLGRWRNDWAMSMDPGLLDEPTLLRAEPSDRALALAEALTEEMVALHDAAAPSSIAASVGVATFLPSSEQSATRALEDTLLNHAHVDELFASTEELATAVRAHRK